MKFIWDTFDKINPILRRNGFELLLVQQNNWYNVRMAEAICIAWRSNWARKLCGRFMDTRATTDASWNWKNVGFVSHAGRRSSRLSAYCLTIRLYSSIIGTKTRGNKRGLSYSQATEIQTKQKYILIILYRRSHLLSNWFNLLFLF